MLLNQHPKLFVYLNQRQLIYIFFQNKQNATISRVIITFSCWYFSDLVVLLNWVIIWLIIKTSSINFDVVIFNFSSWKKIFFERINRNLIITCFIIVSKNKLSFKSLITWIKQFFYVFFCIRSSNLYYFFANCLIFVPINKSFKSFI